MSISQQIESITSSISQFLIEGLIDKNSLRPDEYGVWSYHPIGDGTIGLDTKVLSIIIEYIDLLNSERYLINNMIKITSNNESIAQ